MQTLIGLLAVTGMRIGEAIRLDRSDLDLEHARLVVRNSKFGKSRQLPLHPTTIQALRGYLRRRDQLRPRVDTPALLITATGKRLDRHNVERQFRQLRRQAGLTSPARIAAAAAARHPPQLCRSHHAGQLPGRRRSRRTPRATGHLPRACRSSRELLVPVRRPRAPRARRRTARIPSHGGIAMSALAPTLQAFFIDRLIAQRHASPHTIASYRNTMRLLLEFAQDRSRTPAAQLDLGQLDADLITAFLEHLEHDRQNTVGTRNARLAAIRSLYRFASLRHPEHAALIARVLAIPTKRHDRTLITHLTDNEINALLTAPDQRTWIGRRDRAMLALAIETGLRVSELTGLTCGDTHLGAVAHIACHGKGRKDRDHPTDQAHSRGATQLARRTRRASRRSAVPNQPRQPR